MTDPTGDVMAVGDAPTALGSLDLVAASIELGEDRVAVRWETKERIGNILPLSESEWMRFAVGGWGSDGRLSFMVWAEFVGIRGVTWEGEFIDPGTGERHPAAVRVSGRRISVTAEDLRPEALASVSTWHAETHWCRGHSGECSASAVDYVPDGRDPSSPPGPGDRASLE